LKFIVYLFFIIGLPSAHADQRTDFFRAVLNDSARTVTRLLERGLDPNTPDEHGQTALVAALKEDSHDVVEALLKHPALQPDLANRAGETPLMMAALRGNRAMVERLLALGAQVNRDGWTPLHYAASGEEPALLALLLDRGAQVDAVSPTGMTPLMMAARYGAIDGATLLVARGARAGWRNDKGADAAGYARSAGRDRLAQQLEQAAAAR
jgi:ankyrin repeat protein